MTGTTTIHEELVDELTLLVEALKDDTERGSGEREYLNGLLRDAYVIERSALANEGAEDSAWSAPFLDALAAKLALGPAVVPSGAAVIGKVAARVDELVERNEFLGKLRAEVPALLDGGNALRAEARGQLEKSNVLTALTSKRLLRATGGGPAEILLAARLLEGVGLHLALNKAEGKTSPQDEGLQGLANTLQGWLSEHATLDAPEVGGDPGAEARTIQGTRRAVGVRSGAVAEIVVPGYMKGDQRCSRPVVIASAGAEAKVLSAARELLDGVAEDTIRRVLPYLEAVGAALSSRMEDAAATRTSKAEAALDVVGSVLPVLEQTDAITRLMKALGEDFPGGDVELLLPTAGSPFAEDVGWESRDLFTVDETPPGTIVKLLRPGMKIDGYLVRPALVQVSQGPPPPGTVDEVVELLPDDDPRVEHVKERISRARCLAAGDAGAQLARELSDLALYIRDDVLCEGARRALRMVIDEPPQALVGVAGWDAVREFLDEHLEALYEEGENGEIAAHRLTRPYLQGLRTHDMAGTRLRSLGESMNALLTLYDETMAETARQWLFAELERLASGEGLPHGGHARRLMRTAAKAVGTFYENSETTPAMELTQALQAAGVQIYPEDEEKLDNCPTPGVFHRLEAGYGEGDRFAVVGEFQPAATIEGDKNVTETGSIKVSLGDEPPLIKWLRSDELKSSRLGAAAPRLIKELTELDRQRLMDELRGDAGAERRFAIDAADLVLGALKQGGWQRGADERAALGGLFEVLEESCHLTVLPGYLTYRRLRGLQENFGEEQIKVQIDRAGPKQITLNGIGCMYRDELLRNLDMVWGVGKPPPYVEHLRNALPWFAEVLDGAKPSINLSPGAMEAIRDFESPDAGSLEGVVAALKIIATWLANEEPTHLEKFCKEVKNAPGLELDFFPLPGVAYDNKRLLKALDQAKTPDALSIVRDQAREDGEAIQVQQIAVYKQGNLVSEEPRGRFALKKLPQACEDMQKAFEPIMESTNVLGQTKASLKGLVTRLALIDVGEGQTGVELNAFKVLMESKLIDPTYDSEPENSLHQAGAYLVGRLESAGLIKVERFEGVIKVDDALKGYDKDAAEVNDVFCLVGSAELVEVRRPLVLLEGNVIQKAALMRGIPTPDPEVLEFDKVLVDTVERLKTWIEGTGALAEPLLGKTEKTILPRTVKRITDVRAKMFRQKKKDLPILPPDTQRRDLIRFIIDQVHRSEDVLSIIQDQTYRGAFGELIFKDVIFRSTGPYLSKHYKIAIDTDVVAGADTQALVGRFKKETSSNIKPKRVNKKVWSVVIPCYSQDGVTIRPATVRVGDYF